MTNRLDLDFLERNRAGTYHAVELEFADGGSLGLSYAHLKSCVRMKNESGEHIRILWPGGTAMIHGSNLAPLHEALAGRAVAAVRIGTKDDVVVTSIETVEP